MENEREEQMQRAFSQALRRPNFSFQPQLEGGGDFALYGGDVRAEIPLGKRATLGVTGGASAGRGFGKAKDAKMPVTPRGGVDFRYEF